MTGFTQSPSLVKGGIVLLDPDTAAVLRVISLQYNPETLTRTLQAQGADITGDRLEALRLKAPPIETISVEIEIDATDQLAFPQSNNGAVEAGLLEQLAALETLLYPASEHLISNHKLGNSGTIEIVPNVAPLSVFVWSDDRILPVRITEFTIVEEAFDAALKPIRARVSLTMRVLSTHDLPLDSKGGSLYMINHQKKEQYMQRSSHTSVNALGIGGVL